MTGWIVAIIVSVIAAGYYIYKKHNETNTVNNVQHQPHQQNNTTANRQRNAQTQERTETGCMIYFANGRHGQADKEYRFNYKKINGAWRAYILKMPDLRGRDANSIHTHSLWDDDHKPYICWKGSVTSLKDMQNISRVWADSIQEYIATGTRFGPE